MIGKNNPLNIRSASNKRQFWKGQLGRTKGFCNFSSEIYCYRAAAILIMRTYRRKYNAYTYAKIIETWAPVFENPTSNYLRFVCSFCGVTGIDSPNTLRDVVQLLRAMFVFETGERLFIPDTDYLLNSLSKFNLKFYYK